MPTINQRFVPDEEEKLFLKYEKKYHDSLVGYCNAKTTQKTHFRKIHNYSTIFANLYREGKLTTLDPKRMKEIDIQYFLQVLRDERKKVSTIRSYLKVLHHYFQIAGNGDTVDKVIKKANLKDPVTAIRSLSPEEISTILLVADSLKGWKGEITRGMIYIAFDTGCRPGELQYAQVDDIDFNTSKFFIRYPKGKGRYQDPHPVNLLFPFMNARIQSYLDKRAAYLRKRKVETPILFPNLRSATLTYSDKTRVEYIAELSQKCGIPFSLRTFRSSVVALIVDQNPNDLKPYMSSQIGHQKSTTMDLFYWRVKMGTVDTKLTDAGKAVSLPDMHYRAGEIIGKKGGRR